MFFVLQFDVGVVEAKNKGLSETYARWANQCRSWLFN
jgi:hypothetical protein